MFNKRKNNIINIKICPDVNEKIQLIINKSSS